VACFVAPGFDFNDFFFSEKEQLLKGFPEQKPQIEELERFFK
jgi:predicted cupin superfamily sugar epimerase